MISHPSRYIHGGPAYAKAHQRVKKAYGRAAERACIQCGTRDGRREWAYLGTDPRQGIDVMAYSDDPTYYVPMCVPCHRQYDSPKCKDRVKTGRMT